MQINSGELIRFVKSIVYKMGLPSCEHDDAIGDGLLAAVYYSKRFDADRGTALSTYLHKCVLMSVRNGVSKRMQWEPVGDDLETAVSGSQDEAVVLAEIIRKVNMGATQTGVAHADMLGALVAENGNMDAAGRAVGVSGVTMKVFRRSLQEMQ